MFLFAWTAFRRFGRLPNNNHVTSTGDPLEDFGGRRVVDVKYCGSLWRFHAQYIKPLLRCIWGRERFIIGDDHHSILSASVIAFVNSAWPGCM